jgi:hypothetical protein
MRRRQFLGQGASGLGLILSLGPRAFADGAHELSAEIVIVGGGVGGCAAALAACRAGRTVVLTEETDWIGGQLTSQAVPPDEHPWIEEFGCTRSYRRFREAIRTHYRDHFPLTPEARANPRLNPGNGWVSRLCHEPRVALAVLEQQLAPYVASRRLVILRNARPVAADVTGDRVSAVTVEVAGRGRVTLTGKYFLDATELGDLLPLAGVEHVIGAESRVETGEDQAPEKADPMDQQGVTWCFAIDHLPGEDHTLARPERYAFWRDYVPALQPAWTGKLLSWECTDPISLKSRQIGFDPTGKLTGLNLWTYRRLADPGQYVKGWHRSDVCLVNWPQNDYWLEPLIGPGVTPEQQAERLRDSRQLSLSLLYWMQTEAPRPDGGTGWKGLRLRDDLTDGPDGLAKAVYVREARRIRAEFTVCEQHVGTEARMRATGLAKEQVTAEAFPDSVGVGAYRIDLHPSTSGRNYVDVSSLPFRIPLGALLPRRVENLLAAAKNLGVTHLTNGCYRLHPVEWNIGEAAGALAAFALSKGEPARAVRAKPEWLAAFQKRLRDDGVELEWPKLRAL